uniref:phosphotransferase n=1 Tax=Streptomyces rimosus TaxID=1927 RepID=UPI00131DE09B
VPGTGASGAGLGRADRTELYRQAGGVLRRLHDACGTARPAGGADRWAADRRAAAEEHVAALSAAGALDAAQRRLVLDHAAVLHLLPPLPAGFLHGDAGEHHFLWDGAGRRLALAGFAQARLGCAVEDLVRMAYGACLPDRGLRAAFLRGYGRELTDAERYALPALAALDAAEAWARGLRTGDEDAVGRARGVVGALLDGVELRV